MPIKQKLKIIGEINSSMNTEINPKPELESKPDNELDELIRDLTKVGSVPKSEAKRKIQKLLDKAREEWNNELVESQKETLVLIKEIVEKMKKEPDCPIENGEWISSSTRGYDQALNDLLSEIEKIE